MKFYKFTGDSYRDFFSGRMAFTLIELLVNVSILVIMISLLLPTLQHVKKSGERIVCSQNLKQIYSGLMLYSVDFDNNFPPVYRAGVDSWYTKYWHWLVKDYINAKCDITRYPFYHDSVLICPSDKDFSGAGNSATSYMCATIFKNSYYINLGLVQNPSSTGIITDGWAQMGDHSLIADVEGGRDTDRKVRPRHYYLLANILYCDGHIETKKTIIGEDITIIFRK